MPGLIHYEFKRCLDGYRVVVVPSRPGAVKIGGRLVRRSGGPPRTYVRAASDRFEQPVPLTKFPALFAEFARAPANAAGMRKFANSFGLLNTDDGNGKSQSLDDMLAHQAAMQRALVALEKGQGERVVELLAQGRREVWVLTAPGQSGLVHLELRIGAGGQLETVIVPVNLMQGMWVQFMLHASSKAQLFRCERCSKPFAVGAGTGRRNTAKYCSPACRVAAFNDKQGA